MAVALAVGTVETLIGLVALRGFMNGPQAVRIPLLSAVAVYGAYAIYAAALVRFRPGAPCGCSTLPLRVSGWVVIRAAALCVFSLVGALGSQQLVLSGTPIRSATVLVSAVAIAVLVWHLPAAMNQPDPTRTKVMV